MTICVPVTSPDRSEQRYSTAPAISSGRRIAPGWNAGGVGGVHAFRIVWIPLRFQRAHHPRLHRPGTDRVDPDAQAPATSVEATFVSPSTPCLEAT